MTSSIAFGKGGILETVTPLKEDAKEYNGETGIFFYEQTAKALADAVNRFEKIADMFKPEEVAKGPLKFDKENFKKQMEKYVYEKYEEFVR